jgi:hypothetical protein
MSLSKLIKIGHMFEFPFEIVFLDISLLSSISRTGIAQSV